MAPHTFDNGLYPISTVSTMTGVNAVTLRAWERRYALIKPTRTESGHRLYTDADVEQIKAILQLLDNGISISRVTEALRQADQRDEINTPENDTWVNYQADMLKAVTLFDETTLDNIYSEAMSLYPVDVVTRQLLVPLLNTLGIRWEQESAGVAEEHFFSVFMRNKLGARFHHRNLQNTGPRIVAACLPGEQHEFGLLMFTLAAHARGYRIILLGANVPLEQLTEVVRRTRSDAIALSGSIEAVKSNLDNAISELVYFNKVPVFIGGSYAKQYRQNLEELGAHPIGDDLVVGMHAIARLLPSTTANS